jgi:branched-chain amino acid aminotransferase
MHKSVFLNERVVPVSDAGVDAVSPAALYGKGVFSTVAVYAGRPFLWEKHWRRLVRDSTQLGIDISEFPVETIRKALDELIGSNGVNSGRARITFFDASSSPVWAHKSERRSNLLIATGDFLQVPTDFRLTISPYRINSASPIAGIKSCNYLEKLMALGEAKGREFHEAIQLNERGQIASACMANLFWFKDKKLFTPTLKTGCLAGTTREFVVENLECEEIDTGLEAVESADAVFLTSAGIGIVQAKQLESTMLQATDHPITNLISHLMPDNSQRDAR